MKEYEMLREQYMKKDNEKTIFYLKNLFDSEIMPIFAARMRVAYRRDDIKLRNRSLYIKPQVEYLWL
jgi:siderophore synthetase component